MRIQRSLMARGLSRLGLTLVGAALLSLGEEAEADRAVFQIRLEGGAPYYQPRQAVVPSGLAIEWVNDTASPHTIRADGCAAEGPCAFDSGSIPPNGTFIIPPLPPDLYTYHCELHPIMRGSVIIVEQTGNSAEGHDVEILSNHAATE
jgi:plastocyanin